MGLKAQDKWSMASKILHRWKSSSKAGSSYDETGSILWAYVGTYLVTKDIDFLNWFGIVYIKEQKTC
jgi:hypothetical protein